MITVKSKKSIKITVNNSFTLQFIRSTNGNTLDFCFLQVILLWFDVQSFDNS